MPALFRGALLTGGKVSPSQDKAGRGQISSLKSSPSCYLLFIFHFSLSPSSSGLYPCPVFPPKGLPLICFTCANSNPRLNVTVPFLWSCLATYGFILNPCPLTSAATWPPSCLSLLSHPVSPVTVVNLVRHPLAPNPFIGSAS